MFEDFRNMPQQQEREHQSWYDIAQICPNGHIITAYAVSQPINRKEFCDQCGEKTLMACEKCAAAIQGHCYSQSLAIAMAPYHVPRFCHNCGTMFPWTKLRLEAARDLVEELHLSEEEKAAMQQSLDYMVKNTPRTEVAASKFKRLLKKGGEEMGGIFRNLLVDVLSEAAKKVLFP